MSATVVGGEGGWHFLKCFHANASACLTVEIRSIEPGRARRLALAKQKWPANVLRVPTEDVTPYTVNLETDIEASQRALTSKANEHDNVLRSRLRSKSGPQISRQNETSPNPPLERSMIIKLFYYSIVLKNKYFNQLINEYNNNPLALSKSRCFKRWWELMVDISLIY